MPLKELLGNSAARVADRHDGTTLGLGERQRDRPVALDGLGSVGDEVFENAQQRVPVAGDLADRAQLADHPEVRVGRQRGGGFEDERHEIDGVAAQRPSLEHRRRQPREQPLHPIDRP